jgi:hypothetical protein
MNSRNMKENSDLKIVKITKSMFKTGLNHLLLSTTFNDEYWRFQLKFLHSGIRHNNIGHHERKWNLNNALLLLLGLWQKRNIVLVYLSTFLFHFTMLAPITSYGGNHIFKTNLHVISCSLTCILTKSTQM